MATTLPAGLVRGLISKPMSTANPRRLAWQILLGVINKGQSTSQSLPAAQEKCSPKDRALLQQLVFGSLRHWFSMQQELSQRLSKPFKAKDNDLLCLLTLGLYQIRHTRIPPHAALNETLKLCPKNKAWAKGLINAVLRRAAEDQSEREPVTDLPSWLINRLQADWPERIMEIAAQSNLAAPLTLRAVDARDTLIEQLIAAEIEAAGVVATQSGIVLASGHDVTRLPGFSNGAFVVQDAAAQLSAEILAPKNGEHILDACAAPGGKTTHLLQLAPEARLTALDNDEARLSRVHQNLERLKQTAKVLCGDASQPEQWWDGQAFDRILLDAPCSATGVIRRHPDIKLLRRDSDIDALVALQAQIITALWRTLKPGGQMLYCTCSILRAENEQQIAQFLAKHEDARELDIAITIGQAGSHGVQLLPGDSGCDGFYYCLLEKQPRD